MRSRHSDSTTKIRRELGYKEVAKVGAKDIELDWEWNLTLQKKVYLLQKKIPSLRLNNSSPTMREMAQAFDLLCRAEQKYSLSADEQLTVEQYKLFIIATIEAHIEKKFGSTSYAVNSRKNPPGKPSIFSRLLYRLLSLCGISISGIVGFLGGNGLLSLIHGLSNPFLLAGSAALGVINSILFFAIEANMIKNALGVNNLGDTTKSLLHSHEEQIDASKRINKMLFDYIYVQQMSRSDYENYAKIVLKFNHNVTSKTNHFCEYKEPTSTKILRRGVIGLGAVLAAGNGYFLMTSLLGVVAASLLGTPLGWAIIGVTVATTLSLYFAIRSKAMFGMVNPTFQKFNKIKNKLTKFPVKKAEDFKEVLLGKAKKKEKQSSHEERNVNKKQYNNEAMKIAPRVEKNEGAEKLIKTYKKC